MGVIGFVKDVGQRGLAAAAMRKPTVRPTVRERLSRSCAFSGKYALAATSR
jgi:hypothetical protein